MSTQKIYEVSPAGPSFFFRFLEHLAQKNSWALEFHHSTEFSPEIYAQAQGIAVDMSMSRPLLDDCQLQTTLVRNLQCLDSFFKDDGAWLPRNLTYEALRRVLITSARDLDIRQPAFVVGHGEKMRVVASLLSEVGFKDIYLVSTDLADLEEEIEFLTRRQLGVRYHKVPADELTMQVVSAAIVINSDDLSTDEPLLSDLSYFNYMKGNGYVLDMHWDAEHNLLLEEAVNAELKIFPPETILWNLVLLWAERLNVDTQIKVEEVRESWIFFLKQNSSSV
jgi:shikimate dehydrogenase